MSDEPIPYFEYGDNMDDDIIAELENGELSATIVVAEDEALDGWIVQVFPTLSKKRVIVGISRSYVAEQLRDKDGEELKQAHMLLVGETMDTVHDYFRTTLGE